MKLKASPSAWWQAVCLAPVTAPGAEGALPPGKGLSGLHVVSLAHIVQ